jgi:hypothetical protein
MHSAAQPCTDNTTTVLWYASATQPLVQVVTRVQSHALAAVAAFLSEIRYGALCVHGQALVELWAQHMQRWLACRAPPWPMVTRWPFLLDIFARALDTHGVFDCSITAIARSTGNTTVEEPA